MKKFEYLILIISMVVFSGNVMAALPVTNGLVLHLDASSITGVANGDALGTWTDLSGVGNHATQATAAFQPVYIANSPDFGRAVVRFDGLYVGNPVVVTGDWMALPITTCTVGSFTAFAVAKYDAVTPIAAGGHNMYIIEGYHTGGNANARLRLCLDGSATPSFFEYRAGNSGFKKVIYTPADTDVHVFAMTSAVQGFLDGVSLGTYANTSNVVPDALNIGSFDRGLKDFFDGDLAEMVIYNRVLSLAEITAVNDYLAAKYVGYPCVSNPSPEDKALNIGTPSGGNVEVTLQWDAAADPNNSAHVYPAVLKHYLYMDTPADPNMNYVGEISVTDWNTLLTSYGPLALNYDSTYHWQIEEGIDDPNNGVFPPGSPNNYLGPIWSFTTVPSTPVINPQPQNTYFEAGAPNVILTLTATTGFPPLTYLWYKGTTALSNGADYQGVQTNTLTILNPDINDEGNYYCKVTGNNGGVSDSAIAVVKMKRLLAGYPFEQNANDSLGINNGTAMEGLTYTSDVVVTSGGQTYAADPNGTSYAALTTDAYPKMGFGNGLAEGTVSFWIKADSTATQAVLGSINTGTTTMFQVEAPYTNAGIIRFYLRDNAGTAIDCRAANTGILDGQWHCVAITYQANTGTGSTATIYYDGRTIVTTTAAAMNDLTAWEFPLVLLARNNRAVIDERFSDNVDDLQIYNYALTQTEVVDIYHAVSGQSICTLSPAHDLTGDCLVTLTDFTVFAAQWLSCGMYPECL